MDGLLVVNKPSGPTSHDVVARVRRVLRERRIGHTGTLDPTATGVLPLVVGRATRLARFYSGSNKVYEATVRLGFATDSGDAAGSRVGTVFHGDLPALDAIERALDAFRGTFLQQPPALSAKKIDGTRSYVLARQAARVRAGRQGGVDGAGEADSAGGAGEPDDDSRSVSMDLTTLPAEPGLPVRPAESTSPAPPSLPAPVAVTAHAIDVLDCTADIVTIRVRCTAGFYIRSLAHDLGERLGVGGHLTALCRTSSGDITLDRAIALSALVDGVDGADRAHEALVPLDRLLPGLPARLLTVDGVRHAAQGRDLGPIDFSDGSLEPPSPASLATPAAAANDRFNGGALHFRLLGPDGALVGIAVPARVPGLLHPAVVLM